MPRPGPVGTAIMPSPSMMKTPGNWWMSPPGNPIETRRATAESLPFEDGTFDRVLSNGALNLVPDKASAFAEIRRVLKPGGRLQIGDILVTKPVPQGAKDRIELWTG